MIIINNVFLEKTAVSRAQYPDTGLPEIAFVGKSNVGKSSLINCMINRKALARTSQNPGKTRTLNFYNVEGRMYFVDLPGYGYAKISKSESAKWGAMAEGYLKKREELRLILLLIDSRREPSESDKMMYEWLKYYEKNIIVIATKTDKLNRNELAKNTRIIRGSLGLDDSNFVPFSSETKIGRDKLWERILEFCEIK